MAWKKIIFLAICLNFGAIHADETSSDLISLKDRAEEAAQRCRDWIWEQIDPKTDFWDRGEEITAILGVLPDVTGLRGLNEGKQEIFTDEGVKLYKTAEEQDRQTKIVSQNIERVHVEFFQKLKEKDNDISEVSTAYLTQLALAIGVTCLHDPKDYFGYNLLDELNNRAIQLVKEYEEEDDAPDMQLPALVTVLCNLKDHQIIEHGGEEFLEAFLYPERVDFGDPSELRLERAAMNMMAASCLFRASKSGDLAEKFKRPSANVILYNSRFINSVQKEDGGFGSVYSTALAVHAQRQSPVGTCCKKLDKEQHGVFEEDLAIQWLLDAQKSDGSYGSSITFTSLSTLGLTYSESPLNHVRNIGNVKCKSYANENITRIAVEFSAKYADTTFRESIPAKIGDSLYELLHEFADENPKTLTLEGKIFEDRFYQITNINDIKNEDSAGYAWRAYKESNGVKEQIHDLRAAEITNMADKYLFEYE